MAYICMWYADIVVALIVYYFSALKCDVSLGRCGHAPPYPIIARALET